MPGLQELGINTTFVSTEQTGTGSSQNVPHGAGTPPLAVFFGFTGGTVVTSVVEGAHDAINLVVTVTSGAKFKLMSLHH